MITMIALVQGLVVYNFAKYILMPYISGGNPAGGSMFTIAGIILGWVNMLICIQIWFISYELGFHTTDRRDSVVFWANLGLSGLNVCFQLYTVVLQEFFLTSESNSMKSFFEMRSLVRLAVENAYAHDIFLMCGPGMFFTGYLLCPLMAGVVPYMWNMLLMKMIYVWRCLPTPFLRILRMMLPWAPDDLDRYPVRRAEKGLEGMELGLPWDYAGNIVLPSICCSMLCLSSPWVWQVFRLLFFWSLFYYFWCRYMHLRFMRAQYYTTSRVDSMVNFAWGIPLSIVAFATVVWGLRTGWLPCDDWETWQKGLMCFGAFFLSLFLWMLSYWLYAKPWHHPAHDLKNDPSILHVKENTLYTWFNCNPVYTLKCKYYIQDLPPAARKAFDNPIASGCSGEVRFFEIGKEYLFLPPAKFERMEEVQDDWMEFETYLDAFVCWLEGDQGKVKNVKEKLRAKFGNEFKPVEMIAKEFGEVAQHLLGLEEHGDEGPAGHERTELRARLMSEPGGRAERFDDESGALNLDFASPSASP